MSDDRIDVGAVQDALVKAIMAVFPGDQEDTRDQMVEAILISLASRGYEIRKRRN